MGVRVGMSVGSGVAVTTTTRGVGTGVKGGVGGTGVKVGVGGTGVKVGVASLGGTTA